MAEKLLIVMVNTDPSNPTEAASPFFQAAVAAAMEYAVEMVLMAGAADLARRGTAERLHVESGSARTVYDFIRDAREAGVVLKACTPHTSLREDDAIPEIDEFVGTAYVISAAMDPDTVTFTY